jgi:hypothetical protein
MPLRIILLVTILLTACRPITSSSSNQNSQYKTVYQDGNFQIQETFLGEKNLTTFSQLTTRIQETATDLQPSKSVQGGDWCDDLATTGWCSQSIDIEKPNNDKDRFDFRCNSWGFVRDCKLYSDNLPVWEDHMNGGQTFPIESIKAIESQLVISYINTNKNEVEHIVVLANNHSSKQIENAHSPNEILGKLLYFQHKKNKEIIVFNGQDIGEEYDAILSWPCCGGGFNININSNSKIIDFFAQKGNDWYHVQAGDASYLASLRKEGK